MASQVSDQTPVDRQHAVLEVPLEFLGFLVQGINASSSRMDSLSAVTERLATHILRVCVMQLSQSASEFSTYSLFMMWWPPMGGSKV